MQLKSWQKVWREGVVPQLSTQALTALKEALEADDHRLAQGCTTSPPPLQCVQDWPVERACPLAYCGWRGEGLGTVAEVEEYFARMCFNTDTALGEPAGCRHFLSWWDDTPRSEAVPALLAEVVLELEKRGEK